MDGHPRHHAAVGGQLAGPHARPRPGAGAVQPAGPAQGAARGTPDADGTWRAAGWPYAVVANHVRCLWRQELATPGCFRRSIGAVRTAYTNAPRVPDGLVVEIDPDKITERYHLSHLATARAHALPGDGPLRVPCTVETEYALLHLPPESAAWLFPEHAATRAACVQLRLDVEGGLSPQAGRPDALPV